MAELLGPYRAALALGRRRSVIVVLAIVVAIAGAIAWTTYRPLRQQKGFLAVLQAGNITQDNFFQFAPGVSCFGGDFGPPFGPKPRPDPTDTATPDPGSTAGSGASPTPGLEQPEPFPTSNEPTCQFISNDGTPIGAPFQGDPFGGGGFSEETIEEIRPVLIQGQEELIARMERDLAPMRVFEVRIRALGTFLGIGFMILMAATLFGAEYRWGVWPTLLTHEPRRGRVLATKLAALWTLVLVGFLLSLAVITGVDALMRSLDGIDATGGPRVARLAKQGGWALLSLEMYATMAASLALMVRTSLAGIASLVVALGDHLAVAKYRWLRHYLPTQQIASLLPTPTGISSGYAWFPRITAGIECEPAPAGGFELCEEIVFPPTPAWRASLVLVAWIIGSALLAWWVLRKRDVPQS